MEFRYKIKYWPIILCSFFISSYIQNKIIGQNYHELFTNNCPHSQKQANIWYFGKFAGLNFNSNPISVLTDNPVIEQLECNACISDSLGSFLMASGGYSKLYLWNSSFEKLSDDFSLTGSVSSTQSSIIIPQPGNDNIFYVFTLNLPVNHPIYDNGLTYSIIDLSYGTGEIISGNNILLPKVSEKITAVKRNNGKDIWIVTHEWNSSRFYSFLINHDGLETDAVISDVGSIHVPDGNNINQAIGQMKLSPDGSKLALALYGKRIFEIFDFNSETGYIDNCISSQPIYLGAYGLEFSPDGNLLYGTTINVSGSLSFKSKLFQFNIRDGQDLFNSGVEIAVDSVGNYFCALQLATDGKIYIARSPEGTDYLGVIHNPTRPGKACNLNSIFNSINSGLFLEGNKSQFGLPNFIQSYFCIPKFIYTNNCYGNITDFDFINQTNVDSVLWDFRDSPNSRDLNPFHQFSSPGSYYVKLIDYFNGIGYIDSVLITINPLPDVLINNGMDTVILLPESYVTLDAGGGYSTYNWSNGSIEQSINADTEGYYVVDVSDYNCCNNIDSIYVELINIVIPNAFIPASSGMDKYFRIIDQEKVIEDFSIFIYNRLGQKVFESDTKDFQWDGSDYGTNVFYYTIDAKLINGYDYRKNGNVTLLR